MKKLFTFDEHILQKVTCIIILHGSKERRWVFNETRERETYRQQAMATQFAHCIRIFFRPQISSLFSLSLFIARKLCAFDRLNFVSYDNFLLLC